MKKTKLITVVAAALFAASLLVAKNLDKDLKDVCAALAPYQALICCGSSCQEVNKGGTQQEIDDCITDCKDYLNNG
jgi:hypothetical protein